MNAIAGCEYSGIVRDAFIRHGHDAMSCDLLPTDVPGPHYEGSIFDVIDYPWDIGIFHPPCTHLSVSGARHFEAKRMDGRQQAAVAFFMRIVRASAHIKGRAVEQPISVMSSLYRKPDQIIQPWMIGHYETKATCLWLFELPPLAPLYRTADECREALGIEPGVAPAARIHKMPPSEDRWKLRSATFSGVADAMARQWGGGANIAAPLSEQPCLPGVVAAL
jgi:hypothetical protein